MSSSQDISPSDAQSLQRPSLVGQVAALLKERMRRGEWAESLPGERKLCEQIGVSRPTLRAALSQLEREGLVKCGQGRRRQITIRSKKSVTGSKVVALLTPLPMHGLRPLDLFWMDAVREQLGRSGYELQILHDRRCYTAHPDRALGELTARLNVAGWILYMSTAPIQRWFSTRRLPCVICGSRHENISLTCVGVDYRAVCRHAAGLFLAKGHQRLVLLNPDGDLAGERESEQGFREATGQLIAPQGEALVVRHDGTRAGLSNRLDALWQRAHRPTAFLVSRSAHVLTSLGHFQRRGLRVPEDVSVISRDEDSFLEHVVPTVARYSLNPANFARTLTRTVLGQLRGMSEAPNHRVIPPFVTGETLGKAPAS